jgi:hypothetical protein
MRLNLREVSVKFCIALTVLLCVASVAGAARLEDLPLLLGDEAAGGKDWLVHEVPCRAGVYRTADGRGLVLSNGLIRRTFRITPNAATVGLDNLVSGESLLRGVKPEAVLVLDGQRVEVGGLKGQPNYAFLLDEWLDTMESSPDAMQFTGFEVGEPRERIPWKRVRHHAPEVAWPPAGVSLAMHYAMPDTVLSSLRGIRATVHYELYDGIPLFCKWLTVHHGGDAPVMLDHFTSEIISAVEYSSDVEDREGAARSPNLHVETDYAFLAMSAMNAGKHAIRWLPDPDYQTQVNYERRTPCLLEVGPDMGPAEEIAPGGTFTSFYTFVLSFDGYDRERNGLAQRRMYRTIAPWATENPLMMHVRFSDRRTVRNAIDQCAEVGFEMVILTFGSGFEIENDSDRYLARMREYKEYASEKGIEIGGYSLLASRSIDAENNVVMPEGMSPAFGNSPCLGSAWGQAYFRKLYAFFERTGFDLLEHDGSYPGDPCMSDTHPGHRGLEDSRWRQWRTITGFYHWCRGRGIFLNVPDWYFLSGSNKTGMGYRETNWSLPRDQQVIHTRQNIYDGTWEKTPSMGWMFVPLTEYHGGGAAATIEPLDEHRDHYERMLVSNLALGAQACYRGPQLYDTERVKEMVKQWVDWYKEWRDILESDLIHGRRADGRDLDWMLHVNPKLDTKGMLVIFNPLDAPVERELAVNLYYTGLEDSVTLHNNDEETRTLPIARNHTARIPVSVPARGFCWYALR